MSASRLLGTFGVTLGVYGFYKLVKLVYGELTSPFRYFPGPPSGDLLTGNLRQALDPDQFEEWIEAYGPTIKFKTLFWRDRVYTVDTKAINHLLMNSFIYQKPEASVYDLKRLLGEGILVAEKEVHKKQRKLLNPAFGPLQIQELTEIFVEKAIQLRDIWNSQVQKSNGEAKVDVLSWFSKMTLDVIGQAGFGYDFGALSEDPDQKNELADALSILLKPGSQFSLLELLRALFPILRFLPAKNDAKGQKAKEVMFRIGRELLDKSKRDYFERPEKLTKGETTLLSLLVHANMSADIPDSQRLSDDDVVAQIPTFIVAGHETTSAATTWALFALTKDKTIQEKLREELLTVSTDNPTMQELNSLPYLDAVIRETLRLHAPVSVTLREAAEDNVLPLETPVTDKRGKIHHDVRIVKGQRVIIPIAVMNKTKAIWGEDAHEFRPERWHSVPQAAAAIPGIWGNILTFLGGPHACIGYRFSLVETKAILFTLLRAFEFDLAVPHQDIIKKADLVARPALKTDPEGGTQLPVLIRAVSPL